ncbi:MAG: Acylphosphatase [Candidatus Heimdallarchaeota archaeon AB_125]|nr:MAG: Acylphosphatase [Candidatus Heimdallarchaeota archaeon AB_125]
MNEEKRVEIKVFGLVQGVFFRASTRDVGRKLGLKGTVRNMNDGSVEIIAEGTEEKLSKLIKFAKQGPPSAEVYDVQVTWIQAKGDMTYFGISF